MSDTPREGWIPIESGLRELTEEEQAQYDLTPEERVNLDRRLADIDRALREGHAESHRYFVRRAP